MFTTANSSCLSGPTGETKSPKSLQPCAGHPEAVQEESGEFWMFLEVLCLNLPTGIEATRETGLALRQTSLSCTHTSTCRQNKKHCACILPYVRTCTASCMYSHIHRTCHGMTEMCCLGTLRWFIEITFLLCETTFMSLVVWRKTECLLNVRGYTAMYVEYK